MSGFTPFTDEQELQIQLTKDTLGSLVAMRSAWIYAERHKAAPNQAKIETWLREQGDYARLQERVVLMNDVEVAEILKIYGAQAQAESAADDAKKTVRGA